MSEHWRSPASPPSRWPWSIPRGKQKGSKVLHRLAWARTYLKKIGAADNSTRGVWTLTDLGKHYHAIPPVEAAKDLRERDTAIRHEYNLKYAKAKQDASESPDEPPPDEGDAGSAGEVDPNGRKNELLDRLLQLDPAAFERLAQRLLREAGFKNVEVQGKSGDGGIDGVGVYRPSLVSFPIYFRCKRYKSSVGAGPVRDFRGAMAGRGEKGVAHYNKPLHLRGKERGNSRWRASRRTGRWLRPL